MKAARKTIIFRWIKILILLYCSIGIALFYLQDHFLFHPKIFSRDYRYHFDAPFEEVDIPFNNDDTINMVKFFTNDSVIKGVVLYFHGNKENINRYAKFAADFTKHGYEVWMEDYPGFGKSVGERTENILYSQASQIYKLAATKFSKDCIVIYGKSFGTGIAAYLASIENCKQLILETPYYSIPALFGSYAPIYPVTGMAAYKIPTNEYVKEVKASITIFHGTIFLFLLSLNYISAHSFWVIHSCIFLIYERHSGVL